MTTDGHAAYSEAVEGAFGSEVDYAQLIKPYGEPAEKGPERKYSPSVCIGCNTNIRDPDPGHISTSHVERQNLTMRMHMRRFARLTNGFSKKFENHVRMVALYTTFYNFVKVHKTLRVTPAMEAGVADSPMDFEDIVALIDAPAPKPGPRGPYKKRRENG